MATTDWNPEQYGKFEQLRSRPSWDLAALIDASEPVSARRRVDVGHQPDPLLQVLAKPIDSWISTVQPARRR